MRRLVSTLLIVFASLVAATPAMALDPNVAVSGSSTAKWYSGSLIQQYGTNCSTAVLGSAYPEVMISGIASFGGDADAGTGLVRVGDKYWTSILVGVVGNPCGPGSSLVQTDVVLPPNTIVDTSRQIRCFGEGRSVTDWIELTGGRWSFNGMSGDYCPSQASPSTVQAGAVSVGGRLLASGQLFQVFLPVKSTGPVGGSTNGVQDGFRWLTNATGVYANPGLSEVAAYLNPAGAATTPSVFFTRTPSAQPWWNADYPDAPGQTKDANKNRAEFWANINTQDYPGTIYYDIYRLDGASPEKIFSTDPNRPGNVPGAASIPVPANQGVTQIIPLSTLTAEQKKLYVGPNGGTAPVSFDPPGTPGNTRGEWDVPMRITWTFKPSSGPNANQLFQQSTTFRTLVGPDTDGDGVADIHDACPNEKGNGANGCTAITSTVVLDDDGDGVLGLADLCPTVAGPGTVDGCPVSAPVGTGGGSGSGIGGGGAPTPNGPAVTAPILTGAFTLAKKPKVARAALVGKKGATLTGTCTPGATSTMTLTATKSTAKALGLSTKKGLPVLASGSATCVAGKVTSFKLTTPKAIAKKLTKKTKASLSATLTLVVSAKGSADATTTTTVSLI
ncbi:MAG: thrombospondin type 3 repeat-containing protein [Solirubrobacteraceae bacterium]|nr:thrombospondin type 3 repeat-containing protein [Patulibacter sp.]